MMNFRKPLFAGLALAWLLGAPALAANGTHFDKNGAGTNGAILSGVAPIYLYNSAGSGQMGLSVSSLTNLTPPPAAALAQICVETAAIRYRDDGTAPTSSSGMPIAAGTCFQYAGPLAAIQFIGQSGSPTIDVLYYVSN